MSKLMFKRGNLHTGNVYGVKVVGAFGSYEIHGPFSGENDAWNYGMALAMESVEYEDFVLVTIETPFDKEIATAREIREHRAKAKEEPFDGAALSDVQIYGAGSS